MYQRPDYDTARRDAGFKWSVASAQETLRALTDVPIRDFYLEPEACIQAYREGRPLIREMFGPDVRLPGLMTPAISYGHVNCLGCDLHFPEGGEVAHSHACQSRDLDETIEWLRRPVDFLKAGMAPFYLDFREKIRQAFPGETVTWAFSYEGPITTAYEVRGEAFFADIFDQPEKTCEFLAALTDSIVQYARARRVVDGLPPVDPEAGGMADDISSNIPPRMWERFVLPYWERYYTGITTGKRTAHVEDLRPEQLAYLEAIGLSHYDPSVSHRLDPQIISRRTRVPFQWRLVGFHTRYMTCPEVMDWVFAAVADGASALSADADSTMCNPSGVRKVHAFIEAAKAVDVMFASGATRADVGRLITPEGRKMFWAGWPFRLTSAGV